MKCLNNDIAYHHFQMETLQTTLKLITPGCFMASIDLKDTFCSVHVGEEHRKLLRFKWKGQLWQYDCLPNGTAMAPRKSTKLLKPVFAWLRAKGHVSTAFLDDSLLIADSEADCVHNVVDTVRLLRSFRFIIHPDKSVLRPTQSIQYLWVITDTKGEVAKVIGLCQVSQLSNIDRFIVDSWRTTRRLLWQLAEVTMTVTCACPF